METSTTTVLELQPASTLELQLPSTAPTDPNANPNADESSPDQYPTGIRFILLTTGLILSIFLAALDSSILATAIPRITDHFGTVKDVGWYSAGYVISTASFQSSWGRAYKFFPLMGPFISAILTFEVGNIICALSQNSPTLILGRIVAGTGGGGIMTGCFIIIALSVRAQLRAAYMGVLGVTFGCASVAGPLLGGFLTDGPGWRWCFWISLPIGVVAATLLGVTFRTPPAARPVQCSLKEKLFSLDLVGACLVLGSMTCFVLAMQRAAIPSQWSSWPVITSLSCSVLLVILFILNERIMGPRAMIQGHLFKKRNITTNLIYQFFLAGLFFPLTYALPIQFQSVNNASATQSGTRLIPLILGVSIFTMVANGILTLSRRFITPFLLMGAVIGTLGAGLIHTLGAEPRVAPWIGFELIIGLGVGIALQVPMIANQAAVGIEDVAGITALTLFVENIGTAVFIAGTEAAFTNGLVRGLERNAPGLKAEVVIDTGATRIREAFGGDDVNGILEAYLNGCRDSFLVPIACGAAAAVVSLWVVAPGVKREFESRVKRA